MSEGNEEQPRAAPQGSVFGNLPGSRPGTRSPRRQRDRAASGPKATSEPRASGAEKPTTPSADRTAGDTRRPTGQQSAQGESGAGLEDIAWAGVAAAAEAATLGVRLASRAIEALRGNSERD